MPDDWENVGEDQLRRLGAITDTALAHVDLEDLLDVLLGRVRELLHADTAAVLLHDEPGQRLVASAAAGLEEEVSQGVSVPVGEGFAGRIAVEKRPVILDKVNSETVWNPLLVAKGIRALLGVPLLVGGKLVGVLHVGTLDAREFTEDDAHLLQLAGDRIALVTRARVSSIERTAAATLQRSLLPPRLPEVPGLEFATRYVPGPGSDVGGTWYDRFSLSPTRWGIVIGDVVGHGLAAAAVMGRLRSALRAYARQYKDPSETLDQLDRYVWEFEPDTMATAVYAIFEPTANRLDLSVAGHPVPIRALPDQPASAPKTPVDPMIGTSIQRGPRHTTTIELPPGALLCFYTNGLIENPDLPLDVRRESLRATVTADLPELVCANVMARLIGRKRPPGDVAMLVMRHKHTPNPR